MKIIITKPYDGLKVGDILEKSVGENYWWNGGTVFKDTFVTLLLEAGYAKEYEEEKTGVTIKVREWLGGSLIKREIILKSHAEVKELANRINKVIKEYDQELQGDCKQGTFPNKMRCQVVGCANEVVQDTNVLSDLCREHTRGH